MRPAVNQMADMLLEARDATRLIPTPLGSEFGLTLDFGYQIGRVLHERLADRGYQAAGRKIGLTNRTLWEQFQADQPIWSHMYAQTVHTSKAGVVRLSISGMAAPRLEPEIVLKLRSTVPTGNPSAEELVSCVEWVAVGFEIVDSHYPEWRLTAAEAVADFGVHAALAIGKPWEIGSESPCEIAAALESLHVTLCQEESVFAEGYGRNALGSPLLALGSLARVLASQPWAPTLGAGEIITTGALTPLPTLKCGDRWRVSVTGARLSPLELLIDD